METLKDSEDRHMTEWETIPEVGKAEKGHRAKDGGGKGQRVGGHREERERQRERKGRRGAKGGGDPCPGPGSQATDVRIATWMPPMAGRGGQRHTRGRPQLAAKRSRPPQPLPRCAAWWLFWYFGTAHLCGRLITQAGAIVNEKNHYYAFLPHARTLFLDVPSYKLAISIINFSWMTHAAGTRHQLESGRVRFLWSSAFARSDQS